MLAYRAMLRAVELVGRENVYFMVFKENRFILDLLNLVPAENVMVIRSREPVLLFVDLIRMTLAARRLKIDATIDMEFFSRASAIIGFLSGARTRVGLHRFTSEGPYRGDLLTHRHQYNPYLHVAAAYYLLVDSIHLDPKQTPQPKVPAPALDFAPPRFVPAENEVAAVQATLDRLADHPVGPADRSAQLQRRRSAPPAPLADGKFHRVGQAHSRRSSECDAGHHRRPG